MFTSPGADNSSPLRCAPIEIRTFANTQKQMRRGCPHLHGYVSQKMADALPFLYYGFFDGERGPWFMGRCVSFATTNYPPLGSGHFVPVTAETCPIKYYVSY